MKCFSLPNVILTGFALLASQQMASCQTITASMAAPAGTVNTNAPGFKVRVIQGNSRLPMNSAANAEALLSGKANDPSTGLPFENTATPNPNDNSFIYIIDTYINWHEAYASASGGNFTASATSPHNIADDPEPGNPGLSSGDYVAWEITGYLQLPSGTVRLGVNSDDGFKLTIGNGINPYSPNALQVAILDGTRGFGNTEVNLTVSQAGIYPFRLVYWEQTGANSGLEFFNFTPGSTSGNRYLINDRNQANAIKSYRELLSAPPMITSSYPYGGATGVPPTPNMFIDVTDGKTTLNASSIKLSVDDQALNPNVKKDGLVTTIRALAPILSRNSSHTNTLVFSDSGGTSYTNTWTFTTANYPIITADYAVPSVDTSKPGFKAKAYQIDINRNPATGLVPNAERQLAGGYMDPSTGKPYPNTVDTSLADADGYFIEEGVLNWNQDAPAAIGNFSANSTPAFEDKPIPGLTGNISVNATDRCVYSIETILELKAGAYRFGVNSDDGFRLSTGRGPGDVVGIQLGTKGDGSALDTYCDFLVAADGLYPFRLMYWESSGNASCEFFIQDIVTQVKTLINDLTGATPIKAYRESSASRPYISRVLPTVNNVYVFADQDLIIDIVDGALPLVADSIALALNGAVVTPTISKSGKVTTLVRKGGVENLLGSGVNNVSLVYGFAEGGATVLVTNNWSFTVPSYTRPIPPANKVLSSQVAGSGFNVRVNQIDRSGDANQGNGGRYTGNGGGGANMPRPEIQLANGYISPTTKLPYPNLAVAGPNANGSYDIPEVINFNSGSGGAAANSGVFNADTAVPGLPGKGTSGSTAVGLDNSVHEIIAYLDLKKGAHILGVNVDDGWLCSSSPNPRDTLGTLLGFRLTPGGNTGSPLNVANAAFNVIVLEDGIYPFRVLWWQGGGGINCEFSAIDRNTGTQVLINDLTGTYPATIVGGNPNSGIAAFNSYTGPVRPWVKFSVYPMPNSSTLWQNTHQQSGPGPITVKVGSGNPADIANDSVNQRPFGDAVGAIVADLGSGTVGMVVDGQSVTPAVTSVPNSTDKLVLYTPNSPFDSGSTHTAGLVYAGTTNYWTFTVITNVVVPDAVALPVSSADPTARGFRVKVVQAVTSTTLSNTVVRAEIQLAGTPASVAIPGTESDGAYIITNVVNMNVVKNPGNTGSEIGNFTTTLTGNTDEAVPGIPGTGLSGAPRFENFTAEISAYLDLPAGYQKFGIDADDGFQVQIGTAGQTNGPVLLTVNRGAGPRDFPYAFITPKAGLYPIRIVWYQGNGGGNLELFTYGSNNQKILLNDPINPEAIKAYYKVNAITPVTPTIAISRQGGAVQITFTGKLQRASSLSSPQWEDVAGSASPYTVTTTDAVKFFRAVAQ